MTEYHETTAKRKEAIKMLYQKYDIKTIAKIFNFTETYISQIVRNKK